jgi:hypothetical protein
VLKSFKLPTEEGIFSPNVVITSSSVPPTLDFEQFRTANTNKIQQDLNGYKSGKKEIVSFVCDSGEVK